MSDGGMVGGALETLLADVLADLSADVECALTPAFIARVAALSTADQAKVHAGQGAESARAALQRALSAALKARRREEERAAAEERVERAAERKPRIMLGPDEDRVADEAVVALAKHPGVSPARRRPGLRRRRPVPAARRHPACGRLAHRPAPAPTLREYLSGAAVWVTEARTGPRSCVPTTCVQGRRRPRAVAGSARARGHRRLPDAPPRRGVIEEPGTTPPRASSTRPHGSAPGRAKAPTHQDAQAAIAKLADLFCDFPFRTPAHASAAIAALPPLAVYAFRGPEAALPLRREHRRRGKGKCVSIISEVVAGRPIAVMAPVEDDAEQRKRITALAIEGATLVLIDNIVGNLGGPSMDAALTATEWSDRILGL